MVQRDSFRSTRFGCGRTGRSLLDYDRVIRGYAELSVHHYLLTRSDTFFNDDQITLSLAQSDYALFGLHIGFDYVDVRTSRRHLWRGCRHEHGAVDCSE